MCISHKISHIKSLSNTLTLRLCHSFFLTFSVTETLIESLSRFLSLSLSFSFSILPYNRSPYSLSEYLYLFHSLLLSESLCHSHTHTLKFYQSFSLSLSSLAIGLSLSLYHSLTLEMSLFIIFYTSFSLTYFLSVCLSLSDP